MRQLVYASVSKIGLSRPQLERILDEARRHNSANDITGLLWTDGNRFAQILEGDSAILNALMDRIRADPRHSDIVELANFAIEVREFGEWSMAWRDASGATAAFNARVKQSLAGAPATVQADLATLDGTT